jgi:hypothetical protein
VTEWTTVEVAADSPGETEGEALTDGRRWPTGWLGWFPKWLSKPRR